jgi:hypothetical protein
MKIPQLLLLCAALVHANDLDTYDPSDDSVHLWTPPPASQIADADAPPRPVRDFPLNVVPQSSTSCNGDTRYCKLRYDQYTWPGTHNSAAYNLGLSCTYAKGLWKLACPKMVKHIPQPMYTCLWSNQAGHGIAQQLADGLRDFDLDTCQVDNRAVFCHGGGPTMALGSELDAVFAIFRDFLDKNPRQVINLGFGDVTGDVKVVMDYVSDRLLAYLGTRLVVKQDNAPWPTLGELIDSDKRVVVWYRAPKTILRHPYAWVNDPNNIFGTYEYSDSVNTAAQLKRFVLEQCAKPEHPDKWQTLDVSYSPSWQTVVYEITHFRRVEVCFAKMADYVGEWLKPVAEECSRKLKFIHRVHVDQYWRGNVVQVVKFLNDENVKKYVM